jgi:hypothetical protein
MTTEENEVPVSEEQEVVEQEDEQDGDEQEAYQPRTVPLEALEAERRKRQELEMQVRQMQESKSEEPEDDEDDEEFITKAELKRRLKEATFGNKREVMEEAFCSSNPKAVELINKHLEGIIKRKPWLAPTIDAAPNRYARAYEIVQDFAPREELASAKKFRDPQAEAKKIVENSQKPGNPSTIAKSANMNNADYLRSIAGKPEFREYRKKVLSGG